MGTFTKPTTTDTNKILPYIQDPPDSLIWEILDTTDGVDIVSVQAHTNMELDDAYDEFLADASMPKVLRYAPNFDADTFTHLDYVRGLDIRLAPQRTFTNGVLTHVDYFANVELDPTTGAEIFSDEVVCEEYVYTRNSDGFAVARTLTIKWMSEAEVYHETQKARFKTYSFTESIRETDRRRSNVLDELKSSMVGIFVQGLGMTTSDAIAEGQAFFEHHLNAILIFKDIGDVTGLMNAITDDTTHTWLDAVIFPPTTTMRDYVNSTLSGAILVGSG